MSARVAFLHAVTLYAPLAVAHQAEMAERKPSEMRTLAYTPPPPVRNAYTCLLDARSYVEQAFTHRAEEELTDSKIDREALAFVETYFGVKPLEKPRETSGTRDL